MARQEINVGDEGNDGKGDSIRDAFIKVNENFEELYVHTGADLAENYKGDVRYPAGTVLVYGGVAEVTTTTLPDDTRVAGIVSTNPALLMNQSLQGETVVAVALQGRAPCNVVGAVNKGDIIVTSSVAGYGCANNAPKPGTIIGKALGSKPSSGAGHVEVAVGY